MVHGRETEVIEDHLTHLDSTIFAEIRILKLEREVLDPDFCHIKCLVGIRYIKLKEQKIN
jgi:hypothetical protein